MTDQETKVRQDNMRFEALNSYMRRVSSEPNSDEIRRNDDGSLYLPISHIQTLLDDVFMGQWSFHVTETSFGRKWARGSGIMEATVPWTDIKIKRSGDAGIILTGNLRTDSPRLEAMILLSCAKKFGKLFGRDLNRQKEDAPLPTVRVEKRDYTTEEKRMEILIDECDNLEDLKTYRLVIPPSLKDKYSAKIAELSIDS